MGFVFFNCGGRGVVDWEEEMLIRVMYKDGTYGLVKDLVLDKLIHTEKIMQFYRSGHWVFIGREPVRGMGGTGTGYRRRQYDADASH